MFVALGEKVTFSFQSLRLFFGCRMCRTVTFHRFAANTHPVNCHFFPESSPDS
jgi:hypothetical protein